MNGTNEPENGFYVFDKSNHITTSFVGCPVISYEISPLSDHVEMEKTNCTTNPCRDIKIKNANIISSPDKYLFKVVLTAQGGATLTVD